MIRLRSRLAPLCALLASGVVSAWSPSAAAQHPTGSKGPAVARADDEQEFAALMRQGIAEYRSGNLEGARQDLLRAWDLQKDKDLAATLAEVEMKLGRYRDAAEHWERYINALPPDRADAEQRLAECRRHMGSVRVAGEPGGAVVFVDGREVGAVPLRTDVWLEPGEHAFELRLGAITSPIRRTLVAAGDRLAVSLSVAPGSAGTATPGQAEPSLRPTPPPPTGVPSDAGGSGSGATWVLLGGGVLTAAAAGIGVGYTLRASAADGRVSDTRAAIARKEGMSGATHSYCAPPAGELVPPECTKLNADLDVRDRSHTTALGAFVAAGVLGVGTVVTYLVWPSGAAAAVAVQWRGPGATVSVAF